MIPAARLHLLSLVYSLSLLAVLSVPPPVKTLHKMLLNKSILTTFALAAAVTARPHDVAPRHHAAVGGPHVDPAHNSTLLKRGQSFQSVRLSMYSPETGNQVACRGYYHDSDMVCIPSFCSCAKTDGISRRLSRSTQQ